MGIRAYLAAGVLVVMLALAATAMWYRGQAISATSQAAQARADLATAIDANRAQEATIGRLRASAEATDKIMAQMADALEAINSVVAETSQQIGDLKDADQTVADYLRAPVPPDLARLLDK